LFTLKNSEINSDKSDFSPCFVKNMAIFSSARNAGKSNFKGNYSWNNQAYLNLFKAELTLDSNLVKPEVLETDVNSRYHEGTIAYDKTNDRVFITRNNFHKGTKKKDKTGYLNLAIYEAPNLDSDKSEIIPFKYNNKEYSVGHPTVNDKGDILYFVSDMPGGLGGTDIYKSNWNGTEWSEPINLGSEINTPLNEMFPHFFNGKLYFSSDGRIGLGGLDIYSANLDTLTDVQSLGYPINSASDDFGIIFSNDGRSGFLSSNREGGRGDDDIYKFYIGLPQFITISGIVKDAESNEPVAQASIFLQDQFNNESLELVVNTDDEGNYTATIPYQEVYDLASSKKGYFQVKKKIASSPSSSFIENLDFELKEYDFLVSGKVLNASDNSPISGATVTLINAISGEEISQIISPENGYYSFGLYTGKQYKITCELEDFALQSTIIDTRNTQSSAFTHDFKMFKLEKGTTVTLDNIYYDYNKADIRPDAAKELDKLVQILVDNPDMTIELSSHTDSRGSDTYNLSLSTKRANSAVEYIISQGISKTKISSRGYGESKIKNHCGNGIQCSDSEHEINRRTEFTIL
jgi:outer membrane protein OmpA-like peptidoglycan-associated protein